MQILTRGYFIILSKIFNFSFLASLEYCIKKNIRELLKLLV